MTISGVIASITQAPRDPILITRARKSFKDRQVFSDILTPQILLRDIRQFLTLSKEDRSKETDVSERGRSQPAVGSGASGLACDN